MLESPMPTIKIPSDPMRAHRVCGTGLHAVPVSLGNGSAVEWEVNDKEFAFWQSLDFEMKNSLIARQTDGCFLCNLNAMILLADA